MTARRLTALLLVALAVLIAGCGGGGDDGGGSKGSLDDSLGYLPKTAPLVVTFDTDIDGRQYRNLDKLVGRFPFGGQVKNQIKQAINSQGTDFDKDVKPLLGGDLVIGASEARTLTDDSAPDQFVFVYTAPGGDLEDAIGKDSGFKESGDLEGGTLYQNANDRSVVVVKGDTMVGAQDRAALQAAFDRHDGDDKLTESDFNGVFQDLPSDPILRVYGDAGALLASDPQTATARKVPWVGGLRKFGVTVNVEGDGLALDARVATEGVSPRDLPISGGNQSPALARFGDYSVGQRDLSQSVRFIESVAGATDPKGFGDYTARKKKAAKDLGIDIDSDLIDQFTGDTTVAGGLDGSWSLRSAVSDPAAMKKTIARMEKSGGTAKLKLRPAGDLVAADNEGTRFFFGMVDDTFVAGKTPDAAKQIASVQAKPVSGAQGSMVVVADGEAIAKAILQRSGQGGGAAGLFTGPIGDITGYVTAGPEGMRARAKLKVE
jgi:hypothetical protein